MSSVMGNKKWLITGDVKLPLWASDECTHNGGCTGNKASMSVTRAPVVNYISRKPEFVCDVLQDV